MCKAKKLYAFANSRPDCIGGGNNDTNAGALVTVPAKWLRTAQNLDLERRARRIEGQSVLKIFL